MKGRVTKANEAGHDWPAINDLVWVRLPCCDSAIHPSRVENLGPDSLVIAAPSKPHQNLVPAPAESKTFIMGWREGSASKQMRVQVAGTSHDGSVPTWTLRAVSACEVLQRRRFVRAPWDRELTAYMGTATIIAKILDISEGGLRCSFPAMNEPRSPFFQVSFELDGSPVVVDVEVAWWAQPSGSSVQAGLSFLPQEPSLADRLRAHAFALQVEARQNHS